MSDAPRGLVVAGVITQATSSGVHVLAAQRRSNGEHDGLWEFPGGKREPREAPRVALQREIHEELGVYISTRDALLTPHGAPKWPLNSSYDLAVWWAVIEGGVPQAGDSHHRVGFFALSQLPHLSWLPADVGVMEEVVRALTKSVDSCLRA